MPIQVPNLDDRRYADLVAEAKTLIPRDTKEWTDFNDSDPGITLLQLFAWMTDILIYRLNQVPEHNYLKFLQLLGIELTPAAPARVDLTFTLARPDLDNVIVPRGTQVASSAQGSDGGPLIFETDSDLIALGAQLKAVQTFDGFSYSVQTAKNNQSDQWYYPFGPKAREGSALLLGFDSPLDFTQQQVNLMVYVSTENVKAQGLACDQGIQLPVQAILAWEYWDTHSWVQLSQSRDETRAFTHNGCVYFQGPGRNVVKDQVGQVSDKLYWIRARPATLSIVCAYLSQHRLLTCEVHVIPPRYRAASRGRWIYALVTDDAGKGYIQVIDAYKVEREELYVFGDSLPVGNAPGEFVLVSPRQRLYVALAGTSDEDASSGVAVVRVYEETCEDVLKRALDECPDCEDRNHIVLATIKEYKFGDPLTDALIDNLSDRHFLPSTDLLTDVVRCILANGGKGRRGEEGPAGKDAEGLDAVQATFVDCDAQGSTRLEEIEEKRTLVLEIPRGCDAPTPTPVEYTYICGINWTHQGTMTRSKVEDGLLIAFNRGVRAGDINMHTFQVLVSTEEEDGRRRWCELPARHVRGVRLEVDEGPHGTCVIKEVEQEQVNPREFVNGALFLPRSMPLVWRVVLKGDLLEDEHHMGVDANHLPPWLPNRPTGDGVEGGTFESWFTVEAHKEKGY